MEPASGSALAWPERLPGRVPLAASAEHARSPADNIETARMEAS
jgi:hypothetical protein